MTNGDLVQACVAKLQEVFPDKTFKVFLDKYIGCEELEEMVISGSMISKKVGFGPATDELGLDLPDDLFEDINEAYELLLEALNNFGGEKKERTIFTPEYEATQYDEEKHDVLKFFSGVLVKMQKDGDKYFRTQEACNEEFKFQMEESYELHAFACEVFYGDINNIEEDEEDIEE